MDRSEPVCGLDVALAVRGGKWKPLILYHLQRGPTRFGELKRRVAGISEKVLIQQLRELVAAGVLLRRDHQRVPPMVDYAITPFGLTLVAALMPLCAWGNAHRADVERVVYLPPPNRDQRGIGRTHGSVDYTGRERPRGRHSRCRVRFPELVTCSGSLLPLSLAKPI